MKSTKKIFNSLITALVSILRFSVNFLSVFSKIKIVLKLQKKLWLTAEKLKKYKIS